MDAGRVPLFAEAQRNAGINQLFFSILTSAWVAILVVGCAHYPVNQPIKEYHPGAWYTISQIKPPENSDSLLVFLTFSGGGTRAAALSYGVLEELRKTEVVIDGRKRRLLD
jgi:NTE family protein